VGGLKVTLEPDDFGPPYERCCLCRKSTRYWYTPKDVPLCPKCAHGAKRSQIPSKEEWMGCATKPAPSITCSCGHTYVRHGPENGCIECACMRINATFELAPVGTTQRLANITAQLNHTSKELLSFQISSITQGRS